MPTLTRRRFLGQSAALTTLAATSTAGTGWAQPASSDVLEKLPDIEIKGDLAAAMVEGMHKFLDGELANTRLANQLSRSPVKSLEELKKAVLPLRENLRDVIGASEERARPIVPEFAARARSGPQAIAKGDGYTVHAVRWPVMAGLDGEGLLLEPESPPLARIIAIPDADQTPEMLAGLAQGVFPAGQFARRLAESGCQVLIPTLIDRQDTWAGNPKLGRMTNQPHREFIYRMAYELGRHLIGFEVQKLLAAVDWFGQENAKTKLPIGMYGYAEGGLLAFYAAGLDERIDATVVSCYLNERHKVISEEPIYRNVWRLLKHVNDAETALMIVPRGLVIETCLGPQVDGPPKPRDGRSGAAPGRLMTPRPEETYRELAYCRGQLAMIGLEDRVRQTHSRVHVGEEPTLRAFLDLLGVKEKLKPLGKVPGVAGEKPDPVARQKRQLDQLVELCQRHMREAESRRQQFFWSKLSPNPPVANAAVQPGSPGAEWENAIWPFRRKFAEDVIGMLPEFRKDQRPVQGRPLHDEPKWKSWEIVLPLYDSGPLFAYGILCVPKDLLASGGRQPPGEKRRPVVVCQHGLEGRPTDVVNPKEKTKYYNSFGSALADLGYVVFAPQNPYIFENKFRQLQRKANPLGLSLFSFIVRQHERILSWLETLPFVDPKRMAFYGLSYGGKTAMRVPAILTKYCLSICSGDFNEWIWKNVSVDYRGSYMFTREYEMYEFNLGNTFGYAEMAALIAPRPFMVERGHDDGVGIDEWVAYEYAKVRRLYAKLGLPDRTAIEFFNGGHEINSKGTFEFLKRHLGWPVD